MQYYIEAIIKHKCYEVMAALDRYLDKSSELPVRVIFWLIKVSTRKRTVRCFWLLSRIINIFIAKRSRHYFIFSEGSMFFIR